MKCEQLTNCHHSSLWWWATLELWAKVSQSSSFRDASWRVFYNSWKTSNLTGLDDGNVSPQTVHHGEEMWIHPHPETTISQRHDARGQNVQINTYRTKMALQRCILQQEAETLACPLNKRHHFHPKTADIHCVYYWPDAMRIVRSWMLTIPKGLT